MKAFPMILTILRATLEVRAAAASRHTRVQAGASAVALLVTSAIVAAIMALAPGIIPGIDAAAAIAATAALAISPILSRAVGTTVLPRGATLSSPDCPTAREQANALDRLEETLRQAGVPISEEGPRIIAVRARDAVAWTALTRAAPIEVARLLGDEGYDIQGVIYDLATGSDTGRRVRVAPSMRKRYDGQGGQDGQDGQAS